MLGMMSVDWKFEGGDNEFIYMGTVSITVTYILMLKHVLIVIAYDQHVHMSMTFSPLPTKE